MANVILITWHFSTRFCLTLSNMIKFINLDSLYRGQSTDQARFSKGAPKKDGVVVNYQKYVHLPTWV